MVQLLHPALSTKLTGMVLMLTADHSHAVSRYVIMALSQRILEFNL